MRPAPALGWSRPQSMRMTVDLPEPLGPRKPKIEPFATRKLTESTAVKCPKRFVRPSHSIMAAVELASEGMKTGAWLTKLRSNKVTKLQSYKVSKLQGGKAA